jgi:hypothetical protein
MLKRTLLTLGMAAMPVVVAVPAASAATTTTRTTSTSCPGGHFPQDLVGGRPAGVKVGMSGMALWQDHFGWHIRVSEAGLDKAVITGRIYTDGNVTSLKRFSERGDVKLSGPHRVVYRFTNYGGVDGLDFVLPCSSYVKFAVSFDHVALPTSHIVIGQGRHHPASNPFRIAKASAL